MALKPETINQLKKNLLIEKENLTERIKKLKVYPDYGNIGEDNLQEVIDYENNVSIEEQLDLVLQKVNKALDAIENGTYGECRKCQTAIEEGRLEIMPYSDLCVTCEQHSKKR